MCFIICCFIFRPKFKNYLTIEIALAIVLLKQGYYNENENH